MVEHVDILIQMTRAKASLCRVFFTKLILKFYNGHTHLRESACEKSDMILNFVVQCEKTYHMRECRLRQLKKEIEENIPEYEKEIEENIPEYEISYETVSQR